MLSLETAIQAALIAGVVSIIVTLINNSFQHRARKDDHQQRRQQWFLEKQARDAEEIITTLDGFLRTVDGNITRCSTEIIVAINDRKQNDDSAQFKEKYKESAGELSGTLYETFLQQHAWFMFSSYRLSVWFGSTVRQSVDLEGLGARFDEVNQNLALGIQTLYFTAQEELDLEACDLALHKIEKELSKSEDAWRQIVQETTDTQHKLAQMLLEGIS